MTTRLRETLLLTYHFQIVHRSGLFTIKRSFNSQTSGHILYLCATEVVELG